MKKIRFISLRVADFQGVVDQRIEFGDNLTQIKGKNGTGKTTITSAIMWLITGKNIDDLADTNFKIQPLTPTNRIILEAKPTVELVVEVDGVKHTIQKTKSFILPKRKELDPNKKYKTKNELMIDGLERKASQFKTKMDEFFGGDNQFKMFVNVLYFAKNIPWKQQRETLLQYLDPISVQDIFKAKPKFAILDGLLELPFNDYIQTLRRGINRSNDKLDDNLSRISEQKQTLNGLEVDEKIDMSTAQDEEKELNKKILDMKLARSNKEANLNEKVELEATVTNKQNDLDNFEKDFNFNKEYLIKVKENKISSIDKEMKDNRATRTTKVNEYHIKQAAVENAEVKVTQDITHDLDIAEKEYNLNKSRTENSHSYSIGKLETEIKDLKAVEYDTTCSLCHQDLPEEEIEQLQTQHDEKLVKVEKELKDLKSTRKQVLVDLKNEYDAKVEKINNSKETRINNRTNTIKQDMENIQIEGGKINTSYAELEEIKLNHEKELEELRASEADTESMNALKFDISELERKIQELKVGDVDLIELERLEERLKVVLNTTSNSNVIESINTRIKELEDNNKAIQVKVDENKNKVMLCEDFLMFRANLLNEQLKKHFSSDLTFKFFEPTQEGGVNDVFKILLNGVDYVSINTGGEIKVGLEIIKFLQTNTGIVMPIMIDKWESVDKYYVIPETESQIITCTVSDDQKIKIV